MLVCGGNAGWWAVCRDHSTAAGSPLGMDQLRWLDDSGRLRLARSGTMPGSVRDIPGGSLDRSPELLVSWAVVVASVAKLDGRRPRLRGWLRQISDPLVDV